MVFLLVKISKKTLASIVGGWGGGWLEEGNIVNEAC